MGKVSIFSALGLLAGLFISACGTSSSSNNNDNRPKTDEQICRENPNSRACDNYYDDAEEARYRRGRYDDDGEYYDRDGGYYDAGGVWVEEPRGCQVASRTVVDRSNDVFVGIKNKTGKNGKKKRTFEAHVGSTNDTFHESYAGCVRSAVINVGSNVTCNVNADCEGLPVEGKMIDAFCDSQGYCRID